MGEGSGVRQMPRHKPSYRHSTRCGRAARLVTLLYAAAVSSGCTHLFAYGDTTPPGSDPDRPARIYPDLIPSAEDSPPPKFVGELPQALKDVDDLRLAQLKSVDEMTGERAAYNAVLWTLTPYLLYRAISSPSQKLLIGGAAGLGAGYGYLSSESADIGRIHIATAKKLACEMVASSEFLYSEADYRVGKDRDAVRLPQQIERLQDAIVRYQSGVTWTEGRVADQAPGGRVQCAIAGSAACAARNKAHPAASQSSRLKTIADTAANNISDATGLLSQLKLLNYEIQYGAAQRLNTDAQATLAQATDQLWTHTSELKSVTDALSSIQAAVDAIQAKQKQAGAQAQGGARGPNEPIHIQSLSIPTAVRSKNISNKELTGQETPGKGENIRDLESDLQREISRGQIFTFAQLDRSDRTKVILTSQGCAASVVDIGSLQQASLAQPPAVQPGTSSQQAPLQRAPSQ